MSPFLSRILVALVLLPVVLGIVWVGGWWLFALAVVGGLLALHELYGMKIPPAKILNTRCEMTVIGGEIVFQK